MQIHWPSTMASSVHPFPIIQVGVAYVRESRLRNVGAIQGNPSGQDDPRPKTDLPIYNERARASARPLQDLAAKSQAHGSNGASGGLLPGSFIAVESGDRDCHKPDQWSVVSGLLELRTRNNWRERRRSATAESAGVDCWIAHLVRGSPAASGL